MNDSSVWLPELSEDVDSEPPASSLSDSRDSIPINGFASELL